MIYKRTYVQFNNLVFDGYDMLRSYDSSVSFKNDPQDYTYKHGSYVAFKKNTMMAESQTISMNLRIRLKRLPCEMRKFYRDFAIGELMKPGKLWAVQNDTLVWAYAFVSGYSESSTADDNTLEIDLDFVAYEGVWHKADKTKTFLKPYDPCLYLDCENFEEVNPCEALDKVKNCCKDCFKGTTYKGCDCCDCHNVEKEWALCYMKDLQDFYKCHSDYQIEYNCKKGQEFFGNEYLGTKLCNTDPCSHIIAGQFYSDTDIPTGGVTVVLSGGGTNPRITINGNTNTIKGEYDGDLTITPSGDVIHTKNCCDEILDPSVVVKDNGDSYGWEVHRGNNRIVIDSCCGATCAYIQVDALTI